MVFHLSFSQNRDPTFTYEVIVVDDGSRDQTSKVNACSPRVAGSWKIGSNFIDM
jgi:hypothetical protein